MNTLKKLYIPTRSVGPEQLIDEYINTVHDDLLRLLYHYGDSFPLRTRNVAVNLLK